jgi:diguanylate cyclase (GGDEF)-like protein
MKKPKTRISAANHIAFALSGMTASIVLCAASLGLIPDPSAAALDNRRRAAEALALHVAYTASREDPAATEQAIRAASAADPSLRAVRVEVPDHPAIKYDKRRDRSSDTEPGTQTVKVPIDRDGQPWATLHLDYLPVTASGLLWQPITRLAIFIGLSSLLVSAFYLRKALTHLDPRRVIPERVKATLDTLTEGVLILDAYERILLANKSFATTVVDPEETLQGKTASSLAWVQRGNHERPLEFPWMHSIRDGRTVTGLPLDYLGDPEKRRTLMINAAPIIGDQGQRRGALATFDDVTSIEEKNNELEMLLSLLRDSRDEVKKQNEELERLATHDPLTGCLNRRALFDQLQRLLNNAERYGHSLAYVMVDIDHFKSINDKHGHLIGDRVLTAVAERLTSLKREGDLVGRYGGEEFAIVMHQCSLTEAAAASERIRAALSETELAGLHITASFGVSACSENNHDMSSLVARADEALYEAKRSGRNRVRTRPTAIGRSAA